MKDFSAFDDDQFFRRLLQSTTDRLTMKINPGEVIKLGESGDLQRVFLPAWAAPRGGLLIHRIEDAAGETRAFGISTAAGFILIEEIPVLNIDKDPVTSAYKKAESELGRLLLYLPEFRLSSMTGGAFPFDEVIDLCLPSAAVKDKHAAIVTAHNMMDRLREAVRSHNGNVANEIIDDSTFEAYHYHPRTIPSPR